MSVTAGALSQVSVTDTKANLLSAAASGGTGSYTYQWYRSTTTGFSPGGGSLISGATSLALADSGLIPNTAYFYVVVATDTGAGNATSNSSQLAVTTAAQSLSPNQFAQNALCGQIDMRFPYNTVSVQIDVSQVGSLYPGAAVKMVDSAGGIPKVIGCAADSDEVMGFINFDVKTVQFVAGSLAEISMAGNVIYLFATGAIGRGVLVSLDLTTMGGVRAAAGNTGDDIVGWAFDKAAAAGSLIRVFLKTPSFLKV